MKVVCSICGKVVTRRRTFTHYSRDVLYPKVHINNETKQTCHGFFSEAKEKV
jgi:hypothetical protein